MEKVKTYETEISVEERLRALYSLQHVDSEIDKIRTLRGELLLRYRIWKMILPVLRQGWGISVRKF